MGRLSRVRPIPFTKVATSYYPLKGGLDLETPAIEVAAGKCFAALNYEPMISGGYRRINGFERFDGRTSPTSASYWVMTITPTGTINAGDAITGASSSATGVALGVFATTLVLGRVTGTFQSGENLQVSAVTVAVANSPASQGAGASASDDADYKLLAANDRRAYILAVPGSGPIRGIEIYNDTVYVFRDNAGATAGDLYKSTTSGWVKVTFGKELQFKTGTAQINEGDTLTGATSSATGVVRRVLLRSGTLGGGDAVGTLIFASITGTFQDGENLQVSASTKAVANGASSAITRAPGGSVETIVANFTGSTATSRIYGADGANFAFEFDGTYYVPIRTGMVTDTPTHIIDHRNRLFLSFYASIQFSTAGSPYAWTAVTGAGEITTGSACTGFLMQTGAQSGAALLVPTDNKLFVLYGSSNSDFTLTPSSNDLGYAASTLQVVGNNSYGLTSRGIHAIVTTLSYGDFSFDAVSFLINSLLLAKVAAGTAATASTTLKTKSQYRLFFADFTGLVVGLAGDQVTGIMPLDYGMVVRCMKTRRLTTGIEVTYFGSDDGFVYQDNTGTSFDGDTLPALIRPVFNNLQSPRERKRFRTATFEVKPEGYAEVNVSYDLGYGTPDLPASRDASKIISGVGGFFDQSGLNWDQFNFDQQAFADPTITIEGTEKNISFFFYSDRAQDEPHTVQGVTLRFTARRDQRN
jgi:hypothetical protein